MSEVPILIVLVLGLLLLGVAWNLVRRGKIPGKGKVPSLFWGVAVIVLVYVVFGQIVPYSYRFELDPPASVPIPFTALAIYMVFAVVGVLVYVGSSEERFAEFMGPVERFLSGAGIWEKGSGPGARKVLLVMIPVAAGLLSFQMANPKVSSPTGLKITHPTMPKKYEAYENPYREPKEEWLAAFRAEAKEGKWDFIVHPKFEEYRKALGKGSPAPDLERAAYQQRIIFEGRDLYMVNCRPCHGTKADGQGPMAPGFNRTNPANFTDGGTIGTVTEGYAFWRIEKGGPDLPGSGGPWDSAMPIWDKELGEDDIWKIILAEYAVADKTPRTLEEH